MRRHPHGCAPAEMKQLDPMRTVIKNQFPREKHRGRFETTGLDIGAGFCGFLPTARLIPIVSGFVALHLLDDPGVRYRGRAIFDPNLITVGVVAVMMGIEGNCRTDLVQHSRNQSDSDHGLTPVFFSVTWRKMR